MNKMLTALKERENYTITENGALTHKSTLNKVYDMFAFGGAMRNRTLEDCILLFKEAYEENPSLAVKCLFYLRDVLKGQGERRFFRICINWLAKAKSEHMERLIKYVPEFGRWDDLYSLVGTPLESKMFKFMKNQLILDCNSKTPSLLGKWLKSENASSKETKRLAARTRIAFNVTPRTYRLILSGLREKIKVVEMLMSENRWDEIEFDKIPSKAGLKYRNAFARRDIMGKYEKFIKDSNTKVNAKALFPYEVVGQVVETSRFYARVKSLSTLERETINKYWDSLTNYFNNCSLDALAVVDTSGSMYGLPLNIACSIGLYLAEKNKGAFHNHYISFSRNAKLIETSGVDFCDKVAKIYQANLCENTNINSVFDLILNLLIWGEVSQEDLPKNIIIISDMEFDGHNIDSRGRYISPTDTLFESIEREWLAHGFKMPHLIFWNCDARQNNIPMKESKYVSYVSGASPSTFEFIMTGKTGYDLCLEKLNSERYKDIY